MPSTLLPDQVITDPKALPPDAQKLWREMGEIMSRRGFTQAIAIPGQPLPEVQAAFWKTSDALVALTPGFLNNRVARALAYREAYRVPEAEAEIRLAIEAAPGLNRPHQVFKQIVALRDGLNEAEGIHAIAAGKHPDLAPFHDASLYAIDDLRFRYPERAIPAFVDQLNSHPNDLLTGQMLVELLLHLDRVEDAARILETLLQVHPDSAPLNTYLGSMHAESGDLDAAAFLFEKALGFDSTDAKARENLARVAYEQGHPQEAKKLLDVELERNTGNATYNALYGDVMRALGDTEEAERAYLRVLESETDDEETIDEVEESLDAIGGFRDDNVRLQFLLADRALDAEAPLRAIKHLLQIREAGVDTRELALRLAEAHAAMNLLDDPINYLRQAKSKKRRTYDTHRVDDPSDAYLDLLILAQLTSGQMIPEKEIKAQLATYAKLQPFIQAHEPEGFFTALASIHRMLKDYAKAREVLAVAIGQNPLHLTPWIDLAEVLEEEGRHAEAAPAWLWVWSHGGRDAEIAASLADAYGHVGAAPWAAYFRQQVEELQLPEPEGETTSSSDPSL